MYHCQQAAEKAVKGFLASKNADVKWTHDVESLVETALESEPGFSALLNDAAMLTPLATAYRYPSEGSLFDPPPAQFAEALAAASKIYTHVLSLLPTETHPT